MKPVPDGDTTPIRTPGVGAGRARPHVRGDDRARRAPRSRQPVRRPLRPHRCPRPLTTSSASDRGRSRRGRIRFDEFMRLALYGERGFYSSATGRGRPATAATSSRRRRSARCSAPCWRGRSTRWWDDLDRPDPFTVVDAGAGPGTLARAILAARPQCARRCGTWRSRCRPRSARLHPADVGVGERRCRTSRSSVSSSPTSCSTTCRSGCSCSTAAGARRSSRTTAAGWSRSLVPLDRRPGVAARDRAARSTGAVAAGGGDAGCEAAPARLDARTARRVRLRDATHRRAGHAAVAGVAAHVPRRTSAAATTSRRPASRTSPREVALDQLPGPGRGRARRPSSSRRWGIDDARRGGSPRVGRERCAPDCRRDGDAQPGARGGGAARPGRPRRVHRRLEWCR